MKSKDNIRLRKSRLSKKGKQGSFVCFLLFVFLWTVNVTAQNYVEDMQRVKEVFKTSCHSFTMKYAYYPYDSINRVTDSLRGTCTISGDYFYNKIGNGNDMYEYIKNEKYYIVVDHGNKAIAVNYSSKARKDLWNANVVDSMLTHNTGTKVTYKSLPNNKAEYVITCGGNTTWNKIKVVLDKSSYELQEMWLCSNDKGKILGQPYNKPRIGIFFSNYRELGTSCNSIFSETKFFDVSNSGILKKGAYKNYKILDYMNEQKKS